MNTVYFYFLPAVLIFFAGLFMIFYSSRKFGFPFGYRTELSRKNLDVWNYSNTCMGIYLIIFAVLSGLMGFIFFKFVVSRAGVFVVIIVSSLLPTIAAYVTGRRVYEYYDDNGMRIK